MNPRPQAVRRFVLLALCMAATASCSRTVSVSAPPAPVFAVSIDNQTRLELIVTYDDGSGPRALGAVPAGRSERFVIAASARATVDIVGRSQDGSVSATAAGVALVAGQTVPVRLTGRDPTR
jgi:hypothetical protein